MRQDTTSRTRPFPISGEPDLYTESRGEADLPVVSDAPGAADPLSSTAFRGVHRLHVLLYWMAHPSSFWRGPCSLALLCPDDVDRNRVDARVVRGV